MNSLTHASRLPGWEGRLCAVIADVHARPYELGVHDCFRLACAVIEALTGIDRWGEFAGRYRTARECLALLAEHGHNFTEAGTWFFGAQPVSWKRARRGDVLEYREPGGAAHLVVCVGAHCVGLADQGPINIALSACAHAWRVG